MGINVRVQKSPKPLDVITAQVKLERDLKSCMSCRFFYGSSSQCIAKQCVKEEGEAGISEPDMRSKCFECPYRQSEKYCFPCMKKLLGCEEKEKQNEIMPEQEEKEDE